MKLKRLITALTVSTLLSSAMISTVYGELSHMSYLENGVWVDRSDRKIEGVYKSDYYNVDRGITTVINGTAMKLPCWSESGYDYTSFITKKGVIMIPIESVYETLGYDFTSIGADHEYIITEDKNTLILDHLNDTVSINGVKTPFGYDLDRDMIPLRYLIKAFNINYKWDNATSTLYLNSDKYSRTFTDNVGVSYMRITGLENMTSKDFELLGEPKVTLEFKGERTNKYGEVNGGDYIISYELPKIKNKVTSKIESLTAERMSINGLPSEDGMVNYADALTYYMTLDYYMVNSVPNAKGTFEFGSNKFENKMYSFNVYTQDNDDISIAFRGYFVVDYILDPYTNSYLPTYIERDPSKANYNPNPKPTISSDKTKPIVEFSGYPTDVVYEGDVVKMTMSTPNVKTKMNLNGTYLNDGVAGNSFKFEVYENGIYPYSVISEGGVITEGILKITFFETENNYNINTNNERKTQAREESRPFDTRGAGEDLPLAES